MSSCVDTGDSSPPPQANRTDLSSMQDMADAVIEVRAALVRLLSAEAWW